MPESINGLPDVSGLEQFVASSVQDKGADAAPQPQEQPQETQAQQPEELNLEQFKTPKDLLKGYKEVQGAFTRTTQENKTLKEQLAQIQEQIQLMNYAPPQYQQPPQIQDFDSQFIQDPQKAIDARVEAKVQERLRAATVEQVLQEESGKNPEEFRERFAYAKMLSQSYPQLLNSGQGVRKLFELADKHRSDDIQRQANTALEVAFGKDGVSKLRNLLQGTGNQTQQNINNAYMPDNTTSGTMTKATGDNPYERQIAESVQKGDVDSVLKGIFNQVLS